MIVGLGNPGAKYANTRHNVGFIILDAFIDKLGVPWSLEKKFKASVVKHNDSLFVKPQNFMNNSGGVVAKLLNYYNLTAKNLMIIHDDADLPFAKVRKQFGAGAAGHRGVESIISSLGTQQFWRVRIGLGRPGNPNAGASSKESTVANSIGMATSVVPTMAVSTATPNHTKDLSMVSASAQIDLDDWVLMDFSPEEFILITQLPIIESLV